jgi:hypothetical protein
LLFESQSFGTNFVHQAIALLPHLPEQSPSPSVDFPLIQSLPGITMQTSKSSTIGLQLLTQQISQPLTADLASLWQAPTNAATSEVNGPQIRSFATTELVIVDESVENYQQLVAGVKPGTEVHILDVHHDGIAQITALLATINAQSQQSLRLHLVSHGAPGCLYLGNTELSLSTLAKYVEHLQSWFPNTDSELLLYGCNVAAGDAGAEFLSKLHTLTHAGIAASTTPIGSAAAGGNWDLDYNLRSLPTSSLAFTTATLASYQGVLAILISNLDDSAYTEGAAPAIIDSDITLSSTSNYNDGVLRFSIQNGTTNDQLVLTSAPDPTAVGAISVIGNDIFLGNGSTTARIASISLSEDGTNGSDLVINFSSLLENSSFETGDLTGWTAFQQNYATVQNLEGDSIFYDFTSSGQGTGTGAIDLGNPNNASYFVTLDTTNVNSGTYSLRLQSGGQIDGPQTGINQATGNGSLHGPYVRSATFQAFAGDNITLNWSAENGNDAYEVFGFLVGAGSDATFGTADDTRTELFSQRGDTQAYTEASALIASDGSYQFEFVSGTYDKTGLLGVGASLYVDDVRLVSSTPITNTIVETIAEQITFQTSGAGTTPRVLEISIENEVGDMASATANITVTGLSTEAPSFAPDLIDLDDSGSSNTDNITNISDNLTFTGFGGTPGYTVNLYSEGSFVGSDIVAGDGSWSVTATSLTAGAQNITATYVNGADESSVSPPLAIVIDATVPNTPTIDSLSNDTGLNTTDNITSDTTLIFAGTAEADSTVEVFLDGTSLGSVTATGGNWSFDHTGTTLTDGTYILTATATDSAGNSTNSAPWEVTVDSSNPTFTSIARSNPVDAATDADSLTFRVNFDETVQNVDATDFEVNGTTTATVTSVTSISPSVYDVTVSGGDLATFDGTVGLNLASGQNIQDLAGNALSAGEPATDETYTLAQILTVMALSTLPIWTVIMTAS